MAKHTTTNTITLTKLGEFCKTYVTGENTLTLSVKAMSDYGIKDADNLQNVAMDIYITISTLAEIRESQGVKEDLEQLNAAKSEAQKACYKWFKAIGTRPSKKGEGKLRPAYTVHEADYVRLGELCQQARTEVDNDLAKIPVKFFECLVIATANQLNGKQLGRISKSEFSKAKKAVNAIKAEKAKATKKANEKAQAEKAKAKTEQEKTIATMETTIAKQANNIALALEKLWDSHATDEEKAEISALLDIK